MNQRNFQQNNPSIRQITAEEVAKAQGISVAELQKTQVLNLKEVEAAVRFEKITSKKPAIFVAVLGILSILFGTSFQIVTTVKANTNRKIEQRRIAEEKIEQKKTHLECQQIKNHNADGTDTTYTITYDFLDNELVSFVKEYEMVPTANSPAGVATIQGYVMSYQGLINPTEGYDIQVVPTNNTLKVTVKVDYDKLDLTKLSPKQAQHFSTKVDYSLDTSLEKVKEDMLSKTFTCK